ncbi:competence protein ComEA [Pseudomonas putida]|uniref:Competence protein ComEA n=1 Tax=Pseudomonas putida TaxID=303 RepID=A0A2Z4RRG4_PSEPU|nr:helix-hairpin-helix domain-containing protein [Pseudomonas putida]AWY43552.1 competence protein ComEA [Pseudomonas putida]
MRNGFLSSLVFAFLTTASMASNGAPVAKPETGNAPQMQEVSPKVVTDKIDLNTADGPTLQRELSGIGEAKANAIVAYRDMNGPFASVDELLEVKGIGKAILDRNREKLEVN